MSVEERIRFLLKIAKRVEVEGNDRAATLFRRMAREARPVELDPFLPSLDSPLGHCSE